MALSELGQVRLKAMDLLARREHSQIELKRKLRQREFEPDLIEQALSQLAEEGLQSDARFAEAYAMMRANRGYGARRIELELQERGISDSLRDIALEAIDDWAERAQQARIKKFGPAVPTDAASKAKQLRFLQYRGFEGDALKAAFIKVDELET